MGVVLEKGDGGEEEQELGRRGILNSSIKGNRFRMGVRVQ